MLYRLHDQYTVVPAAYSTNIELKHHDDDLQYRRRQRLVRIKQILALAVRKINSTHVYHVSL